MAEAPASPSCGAEQAESFATAPGGASGTFARDYLDQICEAVLDTPHFRLHYSAVPGRTEIPGNPVDVAVDGDHVYVAAAEAGLQVMDVSIPGRPVAAGSADTPGTAQRIVVAASHVYVADGGSGLQIIRVLNPAAPLLVASVALAGTSRSVAVTGGVACVAGSAGLHVIDVSNPQAPAPLATLALPGEALDVAVSGSLACIAAAGSGLILVDLSAPATPFILATLDTPGIATGVAMNDSLAIVADGAGGVGFIRITTPGVPEVVTTLPTASPAVRVTISDSYAYVTGSQGELSLLQFESARGARRVDSARFQGLARAVAAAGDHAFVAVSGLGLQVVDVSAPPSLSVRQLRLVQDMIRGWPDTGFRDSLAVALERAYATFRDTLDMRPPIPDGDAGGGTDLIDCYVYHVPDFIGGLAYAHPETSVTTDCRAGFTGFFALDNSMITSLRSARETVAHEFFHVVQYAYGRQGHWMAESTATWAERVVWPAETLSLDVPCWLESSYQRLWDTSPTCRSYGAAIFWEFLEETTDRTFAPLVWERLCSSEARWREAVKQELRARGRDFNEMLVEFALWNYATGERHDGRHYRKQALGTVGFQGEHDAYPVQAAAVPQDELAMDAGTNYIRFLGPGRRDSLSIRFDGDPILKDWRKVAVVATREPDVNLERILELDENGDCYAVLPDWPTYDYAALIVANFDTTAAGVGTADYGFTYSAVEEGPEVVTLVARAAPNPAPGATTIRLRIAEERLAARLNIYDVQGRRIRQLIDAELPRGDHALEWDGSKDGGPRAASGVYFYELRLGDAVHAGRLTLLRGGAASGR